MDSSFSYAQMGAVGADTGGHTNYHTMTTEGEAPCTSKPNAPARADLRPLWVIPTIVFALFLSFRKSLLPIATRAVLAPIIPLNKDLYPNLSHATCFQGDSDCPPCPPGRDVSVTSLLHLSHVDNDIRKHVFQAQQVIWAAAPSESSIIRMEDLEKLHSSLNYWCCHTKDEQAAIVDIVKNLDWHPIPLALNQVSCNSDHDNRTVYLLSLYDDESQARLWAFIHRIEDAMRAAGKCWHCHWMHKFYTTDIVSSNCDWLTD